jgi:hypothetical protein
LFKLNGVHHLARSRPRSSGHVWPLRAID